ncbi:Mediator of RNA polymerase II transcription subunit [Trichinella pseudospiralis]
MGQIIVEALNDCLPDSDALYEKEKKNTLEGQEAEEMKNCSVQKIGENFSSVASNPPGAYIPPHWRVTKSVRQFLLYNNSISIFCTEENFII